MDNGGEFVNSTLIEYATQQGIEFELSKSKVPQQNGRSERNNSTLFTHTRALSLSSGLRPCTGHLHSKLQHS